MNSQHQLQPPVTVPASFTRVGRVYSRADAAAVSLGLMTPGRATDATVARAIDAFTNVPARMGFGTPSVAEGASYELVRWSYNYWLMITLYRNHWMARRIVDVPARDMVKAWPRITSDMDPEDLNRIDHAIRRTRTKQKILTAIKDGRLFGGAGAVIMIDGHENRLEEELDYDTIELGSYKGLIPFDRWSGIYPEDGVSTDISRPNEYNLPEYYRIQSQDSGASFRVHASRVLRFLGPEVPAPEYQAQQWWGISVLEPCIESLKKCDNMSWNMLMLTFRANLIGIKWDQLAQMTSGASMNQASLLRIQQTMQAQNQLWSNQQTMLLPADGGFEQVSYAFTGCSELYQVFQYDLAGAAEIPMTRLYGRTLNGIGTQGEADERVYEEKIASDQMDQLLPQLEKLYPVIAMSELGEIPKDMDLVFPSIRTLDDKAKADIATSTGATIVGYLGAGIYTRAMALKDIKQTAGTTGLGTNITDEDIEAAVAEDEADSELKEIQRDALIENDGQPPIAEEPDGKSTAKGAGKGHPGNEGTESEPASEAKSESTKASSKDDAVVDKFYFAGLPIAVEYKAGTRRTLRNPKGEVVYDKLLKYDYGFVIGTCGRDGDEIDVILGPNENAKFIYVADMIDLGLDVEQRQDEDKVLVGFESSRAAESAFLTMYPPSFLGNMRELTKAEFLEAVNTGILEPEPVDAA